MAIQILFDVNQNPIESTIILTNRNGNKVGAINGIFGMNVSDAFSEIPIVSFKVCVSLLIFCLVDLSIGVSGVLKSPTIVVLLLISPFILVSICLT